MGLEKIEQQFESQKLHDTKPSRVLLSIAISLIKAYRYIISPMTQRSCRFFPSCSEYALEALQQHGFIRGAMLAGSRLLKCHPFHPGGVDPVPDHPVCHRLHQHHG